MTMSVKKKCTGQLFSVTSAALREDMQVTGHSTACAATLTVLAILAIALINLWPQSPTVLARNTFNLI